MLSSTDGIPVHESKGEVVIYPNPSSGSFIVEIPTGEKDDYSIDIYNVLGKKIFSSVQISDNTNCRIINRQGISFIQLTLEDIRAGIYILNLHSDQKNMTGKIIIE